MHLASHFSTASIKVVQYIATIPFRQSNPFTAEVTRAQMRDGIMI